MSMLKRGIKIIEERARKFGVKLDKDSIDAGTLYDLDLPMVVTCNGCKMTIIFQRAMVDVNDKIWCGDCSAGP